MKKLNEISLDGKRVLIRVDFNVPIIKGIILNDFRIKSALKTIKYCLEHGTSVVLMSHLGRPKNDIDENLSLFPIAEHLEDLLGINILFSDDCVSKESIDLSNNLKSGEVHLLENLRFNNGELDNDDTFSFLLSKHGDVFINDAFGTSHREHASNIGVLKFFEEKSIGFLMEKELFYLSEYMDVQKKPSVLILGGSKISGKIDLIKYFIDKVEIILIGGAMAFTFLKALNKNVGCSYIEERKLETAKEILRMAEDNNVKLQLPSDVVCAKELKKDINNRVCLIEDIQPYEMAFDIGPETCLIFDSLLQNSKTVIWNGPLGVTEIADFATGTEHIASSLANMSTEDTITIIGGGDTASAIEKLGYIDKYTHISTGGGASLKLLSGKKLSAIEAFDEK